MSRQEQPGAAILRLPSSELEPARSKSQRSADSEQSDDSKGAPYQAYLRGVSDVPSRKRWRLRARCTKCRSLVGDTSDIERKRTAQPDKNQSQDDAQGYFTYSAPPAAREARLRPSDP